MRTSGRSPASGGGEPVEVAQLLSRSYPFRVHNKTKDSDMSKTNGTTFVRQLALWLSVVGALNWGLVGLAGLTLAVVGLRLRSRTEAAALGHGARTA
jgi:hypothetical protein